MIGWIVKVGCSAHRWEGQRAMAVEMIYSDLEQGNVQLLQKCRTKPRLHPSYPAIALSASATLALIALRPALVKCTVFLLQVINPMFKRHVLFHPGLRVPSEIPSRILLSQVFQNPNHSLHSNAF
jgi:hypothetical protein